jgi:hypothetical protein
MRSCIGSHRTGESCPSTWLPRSCAGRDRGWRRVLATALADDGVVGLRSHPIGPRGPCTRIDRSRGCTVFRKLVRTKNGTVRGQALDDLMALPSVVLAYRCSQVLGAAHNLTSRHPRVRAGRGVRIDTSRLTRDWRARQTALPELIAAP